MKTRNDYRTEAIMTTQAQNFKADYSDTNSIMNALDNANVESDQDWENESTTWTFEDGSKIVVCGNDVTVREQITTEMHTYIVSAECAPSNFDQWYEGCEGDEIQASSQEEAQELINAKCAEAGTNKDPQYDSYGPLASND